MSTNGQALFFSGYKGTVSGDTNQNARTNRTGSLNISRATNFPLEFTFSLETHFLAKCPVFLLSRHSTFTSSAPTPSL